MLAKITPAGFAIFGHEYILKQHARRENEEESEMQTELEIEMAVSDYEADCRLCFFGLIVLYPM